VGSVGGEFPINLGTMAFSQRSGCTLVTSISKCGNQESKSFEIEGQTFQLVFEANIPDDTQGFAFFNVISEDGQIVQPSSQDLSQDDPGRIEGMATFSSGPSTYTIAIASESADYIIDVEDCGGSSGQNTNVLQNTNQNNAPQGF
jgi:hypothetical protein